MTSDRKSGTIARLIADRAFGFIHCPADQRDYFFHQSQLEGCTFGQLQADAAVSFSLAPSPKTGKIEAREVRLDGPREGNAEEPAETTLRGRRGLRRY